MKLAADRQAECERMLREAAEKQAAEAEAAASALAAALVAPPGDGGEGGGADGAAPVAPPPAAAAAPAKRKPKHAAAPKSRTELPSSGYHGVVRKSPNCFQCKTLVNGKVLFIGSFNTAESAARAYDVCMRDLASRGGVSREPSYNFPSDAVAEKAAELAEKEAEGRLEGGSKRCGQCNKLMGVRLKVCRNCRQGSGTRSTFKGVRAKSGTAAASAAAAAGLAMVGDDEGALLAADGEAAPAAAVAPAKYQAFVWHDRTNEYIGTYHTEEEAALAYDIRYREVFGDAADPAKLNWPTIADGQAAVDAALRVRCAAARAAARMLLLRLRPCTPSPEHRIASRVFFAQRTAAPRPAIVQKRRKCRPGEEGAEGDGNAPKPKKRRPKSAGGAAGGGADSPAQPEVAMYEGADAATVAAATAALVPLCDVPAAPLPPPPPKVEAAAPALQPANIFAMLGIE